MTQTTCGSYQSYLRRSVVHHPPHSKEQIARQKMQAALKDPFVKELAYRFAIADLSLILRESFQTCYERYRYDAKDIGWAWVILATVCLEHKTLGQDRPGSILDHPILAEVPELRDLPRHRANDELAGVAIRFQTAYETMRQVGIGKPITTGSTSFNRLLKRTSEPEDLWIVLAGLKRVVFDSAVEAKV
jgi:hypothetical protein